MSAIYNFATLITGCVVFCVVETSFMSGIGPYIVDLELITPCKDQGGDSFNFKVQKYRSKGPNQYAHKGSVTLPYEPEQVKDMSVHAEFWKWSTRWTLVTKYNGAVCESFALIPDVYNSLTAAVGLNNTCPPPTGNYTLEDIQLPIEFPTVPVLPYGKYKGKLQMLYKKKVQVCAEALAEIKQKFFIR